MTDREHILRKLEDMACFRQSSTDPLKFTCLAHFGISTKGKLQMKWLADRGIKYHDVGSERVLYTLEFNDANTAMLFKLSFI